MRRDGAAGGDRTRRFYTSVAVKPVEGGFAVQLDSRGVKTPAGAHLVAPTFALAQLLADEWAAQGDEVDRASCRLTAWPLP